MLSDVDVIFWYLFDGLEQPDVQPDVQYDDVRWVCILQELPLADLYESDDLSDMFVAECIDSYESVDPLDVFVVECIDKLKLVDS